MCPGGYAEGPGAPIATVWYRLNSPHTAALLNGSVNDDVRATGRRARDAFAGDSRAAYEDVHRRALSADGSTVRVIEDDEGLDGCVRRKDAAPGDGPGAPTRPRPIAAPRDVVS